ncbi:response regulator [Desulfurispirillum indicum]|uniref:Response regulator receiver n=1 Tax=Desulfurispirillum indicum (strain ATCC BAA-1389 / DSM 22839 / S5) TaxID=653733 RepID=E6W4V2_DESIS|nr:response regulator [Desulfurispirillum indicum]ADU64830.1 response regulator receiver [Desulfurispirillum indicum S5]UCZ56764.1 response regulator [Desulfurispirillum indicum]
MEREIMLEDKTVLVVEDSSTMRRIIVSIIRDHLGCQHILEAANGREALAIIYSHPIEWIFCDWEMPDMSGHDLLREVRATPSMIDIPFIMITTRKDKESIVAAIQAGASSYIVKPFTPRIITEKVEGIFNQRERRRAERVMAVGDLAVEVVIDGKVSYKAFLKDISVTGAQIQVVRTFSKETAIYDRIGLRFHNSLAQELQIIEVTGVLMRTQAFHNLLLKHDHVRAAFQFLPMDPDQRRLIINFVDSLEQLKCQRNGE